MMGVSLRVALVSLRRVGLVRVDRGVGKPLLEVGVLPTSSSTASNILDS